MNNPHRDTIFLEEAEILSHQAFDGDQFLIRVQADRDDTEKSAGIFEQMLSSMRFSVAR